LKEQHPTCRNTSQHNAMGNGVAKRAQHVAPNNVAICSAEMLRSFGRDLMFYTAFTQQVIGNIGINV